MIRPSKHHKLKPSGITYFLPKCSGGVPEKIEKNEGVKLFPTGFHVKNEIFLFCFPWCGYIQICSVSIPDYKNVICLLVLPGWTIPMFNEIKQTVVKMLLNRNSNILLWLSNTEFPSSGSQIRSFPPLWFNAYANLENDFFLCYNQTIILFYSYDNNETLRCKKIGH